MTVSVRLTHLLLHCDCYC